LVKLSAVAAPNGIEYHQDIFVVGFCRLKGFISLRIVDIE